jgi:intergrase/recombinase
VLDCGCLGSLAWWGTALVRSDFSFSNFRSWLFNKYSQTYAKNIYNYSKKYGELLFKDLRDLETFSPAVKDHVIKALICLSKYLGCYEDFKSKLKQFGIKWFRYDSLSSFLRIFNNNTDILKWFNEASSMLKENERLFLKFCLYTGLRKTEAITSFNKIIQLSRENKLVDYYDSNFNCLVHFKYPKEFIRIKKNAFLSFIPEHLILEIAKTDRVSYNAIRKKLQRNGLRMRINELRDFYGTFMLQHGLLEQEVNLLQGRIPASIFVKHYWSPKLTELRDRVFKALNELEQII